MVKISREWVTGPEQGKSSGGIATFSLWTDMFVVMWKNSRINLDGLQNKCTNCKGAKNNTNFGKITGLQVKLDITCK